MNDDGTLEARLEAVGEWAEENVPGYTGFEAKTPELHIFEYVQELEDQLDKAEAVCEALLDNVDPVLTKPKHDRAPWLGPRLGVINCSEISRDCEEPLIEWLEAEAALNELEQALQAMTDADKVEIFRRDASQDNPDQGETK